MGLLNNKLNELAARQSKKKPSLSAMNSLRSMYPAEDIDKPSENNSNSNPVNIIERLALPALQASADKGSLVSVSR
ncbi:hypothetical protein TUM4261_33440 [Shewanella sp. c952]|nr:hypothetical protein TUM4261_33440 [Shewanella sp. c952]